jgi:hypothetical protein
MWKMWFDIYLNAMLISGPPFRIITCVLNLEHAQDNNGKHKNYECANKCNTHI